MNIAIIKKSGQIEFFIDEDNVVNTLERVENWISILINDANLGKTTLYFNKSEIKEIVTGARASIMYVKTKQTKEKKWNIKILDNKENLNKSKGKLEIAVETLDQENAEKIKQEK